MTYYRSTGSGAFHLGAITRGAEHNARMELGGIDFCAGSNANAADAEETASTGGIPEEFKASTDRARPRPLGLAPQCQPHLLRS